eukprot:jgi/Bigna1/135309/aug1.28_g10017
MASIAKIALVKASKENNLQEVSLLLSQKTDPNGATGHGISPLLVACTNGAPYITLLSQTYTNKLHAESNVEIVRELIKAKAKIGVKKKNGQTTLLCAAASGSVELPSLKNLNSLLRLAAQVDQANCCQYLLDLKANPNDEDLDNFTASMYAIENRYESDMSAIRQSCSIKTLRTLLDAKAHIGFSYVNNIPRGKERNYRNKK